MCAPGVNPDSVARNPDSLGKLHRWYHSMNSIEVTMAITAVKRFSLKIPGNLYDQARILARKRGISLNQLAVSGLRELLRKDVKNQLRKAYERLAVDDTEMDVNAFVSAQADVVNNDRTGSLFLTI
jgi:hypothetical protein